MTILFFIYLLIFIIVDIGGIGAANIEDISGIIGAIGANIEDISGNIDANISIIYDNANIGGTAANEDSIKFYFW